MTHDEHRLGYYLMLILDREGKQAIYGPYPTLDALEWHLEPLNWKSQEHLIVYGVRTEDGIQTSF